MFTGNLVIAKKNENNKIYIINSMDQETMLFTHLVSCMASALNDVDESHVLHLVGKMNLG